MIIHIAICDLCKRIIHGGTLTLFCTAQSDEQWDVCAWCESGKFRVVNGTKARAALLRARVEALVVTELQLLKDSA